VRPCPYCAEAIEDHAQICPFCNTNLVAPVGSSGRQADIPPANPTTSGKAIVSLVCGFLFFFLPTAVLAVIMGHLSLSEIRRSAGRIGGRGMAIAGLVLGYAGLSVIPVLIIAAIAIPNLLRARMAANEASAVASLRRIDSACVNYASEQKSFPPSLARLGQSASSSADGAALLDNALASGQKTGYLFTYRPGATRDGVTDSYQVYADPINQGVTGTRHFFSDQTLIIRGSRETQANADSPPLD
jgi:type IV pilus assembly protein PilA